MPLVITPLLDIPLIQKGDDLTQVILQSIERMQIILQNGDVFVFAQKVISKAEGRQVYLPDVTPSPEAEALAAETEKDPRLVEMIIRESKQVLRSRPGLIIVEHNHGFICANAGIDRSNVAGSEDWILLLPEDSDASAQELRQELDEASGAKLGVLIIDSHGRAWRNGTVGVTIGLSGLPGLVDRRGETDLFGYEMKVTQVGASDELAAAASLMMGQVAEGTPVVHVSGFPYPLREASLNELLRPEDQDLFR